MLDHVAVVTPTFGRHDKHLQLVSVFAGQDYAGPLRLYVLDDSPTPSPVFTTLRDPRVRYTHHKGGRLSIGTKRNLLCKQARRDGADVIVAYDDDDLYEKSYVSTMLRALDGYDIAKLSVFNIVREYDGTCWQWDTRQTNGVQCVVSGSEPVTCAVVEERTDEERDFARLGYGFSYVMRGHVFDRVKFPDMDRGEDYVFMKDAIAAGARVNFVADHPEIVWHTVHPKSTSRSFPQVRLDGPMPPVRPAKKLDKFSFENGKKYALVAMVKREHTLAELQSRAGAYGIEIVDVQDDAASTTGPAPNGYRYVTATVQATRDGRMPVKVPAPLSWFDDTRLVTVTGLGAIARPRPRFQLNPQLTP